MGAEICGQASQYVGKAIHVGEWRNTLSHDEETRFRALEYLHAKGAGGHRAACVAADEHHPNAMGRFARV